MGRMSDVELSEAQIDLIAERAAEKALQKIYAEVGQSVIKKVFFYAGLVTVSVLIWLGSTGRLQQ